MSLTRRSTRKNNNNNNGEQRSCAPCKFQRRKCVDSCTFYPYFATNKMEEFQASHKIFGVSNMTKMLSVILAQDRPKAIESIVWEACRWQEDPVNGPLGFHKNLVRERDYLVQERDFYKNRLNQVLRENQQNLVRERDYALTLRNNDYIHKEQPVPLATNYSNNNYNNVDNGDLEYLPLTSGTTGASFTSTDRHRPLSFRESDPLRIFLGCPSNPPPVMIDNYNPMEVRNSNNVAAGGVVGQSSSSGFVQSHHHQQTLMNQQQQLGGNHGLDFYGSNLALVLNDDEAPTTSLLPPRMGGHYIAPLPHHQVAATRDGDGSNYWTASQIGPGFNPFNHRNNNRGN